MNRQSRSNVAWLVAEKVLRVLAGALVSAAVARYLGPESYGALSISIGVVAIAVAAANMGADHVNLSEISRGNSSDGASFIGSALVVRSLWALACFAAICIAIWALQLSHQEMAFILSLGVPVSVLTILAGKIQADGAFGAYSRLAITSILFGAVLRVLGILMKWPLEYFAAAFVAESACFAALMVWWYRASSGFSWQALRPSRARGLAYFRMCLPTAISATLIVVYLRFELFMVDALIGKAAAGMWAASLMFTAPWGMVAASIIPVANRRLSLALDDGADYELKLVKLLRAMLALAVVAAMVNCLAVWLLVPHLLGPKFQNVTQIVFITSLSFIPLFSGSVQELWIAHQRTTATVLKKVLLGLPVSAALYYAIVPAYSLPGAAAAMVISYLFTAFALNALLDRRFFKIQLRSLGLRHG